MQKTLNTCISNFYNKHGVYPIINQEIDSNIIITSIGFSPEKTLSFGYAYIEDFGTLNYHACESAVNALRNFDLTL